MFGVNWSDPQTLWLNITNLALGVVTLSAVLIVVGAVGWELVFKHRRVRESVDMDAELSSMLDAATYAASARLGTNDGGRRHAGSKCQIKPPKANKEVALCPALF